MRARNLGALVTNLGSGGGGRGGRYGSTLPAAAEVILHCDLFESQGATGAGSGSAEGLSTAGAAAAAATAGHSTVQRHPAGRLLVRRRVTRGGRSDLAIQRLPASGSAEEQAGERTTGGSGAAAGAGGASAGGSGSREQWQAVTPAALRSLLAPYGIQAEAVDR